MDLRSYAKQVVTEKDKNKNGWLDGDELKEFAGPAAAADLNNDKGITVEELGQALGGGAEEALPAADHAGQREEG